MALADRLERPRQAIDRAIDNGRRAYENLNDRERKLVMALGGVFVAIAVLLPLYLMNSAISDLEEENRAIVEVMRDIDRARPTLRRREAERKAAMRLYDRQAPPLGSFLEQKAKGQGLVVREVNDQPEKDMDEYVRRHVRVTLPNVGLAEVVRMMAAIENSPFPVAIERIHVDHFRTGNRYNVQLGVIAFDRKGGGEGASAVSASNADAPAKRRRRKRRMRRPGKNRGKP